MIKIYLNFNIIDSANLITKQYSSIILINNRRYHQIKREIKVWSKYYTIFLWLKCNVILKSNKIISKNQRVVLIESGIRHMS